MRLEILSFCKDNKQYENLCIKLLFKLFAFCLCKKKILPVYIYIRTTYVTRRKPSLHLLKNIYIKKD